MNRFAAAVLMVAGISLPICWFWQRSPAPPPETKAVAHHRSLSEKLNTIIIPDYPTSDIPLAEAVEHLRLKSREYDTAATKPWDRGINIVIITGGEKVLPASSGLSMRDVPLAEALRHITELVNLKYTIEQHAVAIRGTDDMRASAAQKASALQQRLEKEIRPLVSFQDASLEEAVEYLRISRGCRDIGDAPVADVPFNFVLHLRKGVTRPHTSLDLKDIPMSEALRYCAEISNAWLRYDTSAVMITDVEADAPESALPSASSASPILPAVAFEGAPLSEALEFIRVKSRQLDPDHREPPITVKPGAPAPLITLWLKNISIHETLRYIAEISGHRLSQDGAGYVLSPSEVR